VSLNSIIGPCFIQPDPLDAKVFYYNDWIGNTAVTTLGILKVSCKSDK